MIVINLNMGKASIVAPINALSAGVAVVLAIIILSEKLTLVKSIGIILGITAAVLLSL